MKPWWLPDFRAWVAFGLFVLTFKIIDVIERFPALLDNASFMQLAQQITGAGGLLLIVAFLFSASKGASDANARADKANDRIDKVLDAAATKAEEVK